MDSSVVCIQLLWNNNNQLKLCKNSVKGVLLFNKNVWRLHVIYIVHINTMFTSPLFKKWICQHQSWTFLHWKEENPVFAYLLRRMLKNYLFCSKKFGKGHFTSSVFKKTLLEYFEWKHAKLQNISVSLTYVFVLPCFLLIIIVICVNFD